MMKKFALTVACALALVTIAPVSHNAAVQAAPVAAARVAVVSTASMTLPAAADVSIVSTNLTELTPFAMSQVHGAGFWSWVKNTVKKLAKWLWDHHTQIITFIEQVTSNSQSSGTNGAIEGDNRTDYISATEDASETYDENGALVSSSSSYSESVDYTEYTPSGN